MEITRPLDGLNEARNKRVVVELKSGKQYIGILKAFDVHVNLYLEEVEERHNGEILRKLGKLFIRGDTIVFVNPSE